ncbi:MAG TPA: hypothetical protein VG165_04255 [Solirubrobacteraceae bacterium]|jgi:hypothetical protein|nr:hypothetical protein [Solirubrobacteraceae bacterium]
MVRTTGIPVVGIGILVCAIAAPLVAQRAAVWSTRAGDADQNQLENQALREEHFSRDLATVNQDARTFGYFAEYESTSLVAAHQATAQRSVSPGLALSLLRSAQLDRSLAAGYRQALQSSGYRAGPPLHFDFRAALDSVTADDPDLQEQQAGADSAAAAAGHRKAIDYTGIATLWTAGLFFCTLAEVARRRSRARRVFACSAGAVVLAAVVLTIPVWL